VAPKAAAAATACWPPLPPGISGCTAGDSLATCPRQTARPGDQPSTVVRRAVRAGCGTCGRDRPPARHFSEIPGGKGRQPGGRGCAPWRHRGADRVCRRRRVRDARSRGAPRAGVGLGGLKTVSTATGVALITVDDRREHDRVAPGANYELRSETSACRTARHPLPARDPARDRRVRRDAAPSDSSSTRRLRAGLSLRPTVTIVNRFELEALNTETGRRRNARRPRERFS